MIFRDNNGQMNFQSMLMFSVFVVILVFAGVYVYKQTSGQQLAQLPLPPSAGGVATPAQTLSEQQRLIQTLTIAGVLMKSATVTVKAYDQEADTSSDVTSSINASVFVAPYRASTGTWDTAAKVKDKDTYSLGDASITQVKVGDKISVYPIDTAYAGDSKESVIVDGEQMTIEINAYTLAAPSSMTIQGYDETGSTELSAPTNNTFSNADYTIGANAKKLIFIKLTNDDDNSLRRVCSVAIVTQNSSRSLTPKGITLFTSDAQVVKSFVPKKSSLPRNLSDTTMNYSTTVPSQINTKWEEFWTFGEATSPQKMSTNNVADIHEWYYIKMSAEIESSGTDPQASTTTSAANIWSVLFLDCSFYETQSGGVSFGAFDDTSNEVNIGGYEETPNSASVPSGTSGGKGVQYATEGI